MLILYLSSSICKSRSTSLFIQEAKRLKCYSIKSCNHFAVKYTHDFMHDAREWNLVHSLEPIKRLVDNCVIVCRWRASCDSYNDSTYSSTCRTMLAPMFVVEHLTESFRPISFGVVVVASRWYKRDT